MWHGGGQYWENKLRDIIHEVSHSKSVSYIDALSFVSKNIATLELIPYHSKIFKLKNNLYNQMYTPKLMIDFVREYVVPRVRSGKACIICTRRKKRWHLPKNKNIIVYTGGQTRGASLSKNTTGGKKIIKFLK